MAADDSNRPRFNTYGNSTRSQGLQHVPGRLPVEGKSCQYERQAAKVMMTRGTTGRVEAVERAEMVAEVD